MNDDLVYLNGTLVRRPEAKVSAMDRGFLYGDGFFETMRIVSGVPFRLDRHMERLNRSCLESGWGRPVAPEPIRQAVESLVRLNEVQEGYLRITASRGPYTGHLTDLAAEEPTVLVDVRAMDLPPLDAPPPCILARSPYVLNERSPLAQHKSLSYQANALALAEGRRRGADEVYFLNCRGHLSEGAISNLFFVRGGSVHTPAVECGLLPGITREAVVELCAENAIPCRTGEYEEQDLLSADEAFCTNSLRGIVAVKAVLGCPRGFAQGPVTARLQSLYAALVRKECSNPTCGMNPPRS
jgi:branched-chain amino acid aminotransferase